MSLKKNKLYREARYFYRAATHYGRPWAYLANRYFYVRDVRRRAIDVRPTVEDTSLHILVSHDDLTMLLWALASWYRVGEKFPRVFVHEDGSFTNRDIAVVRYILPHATLIQLRDANNRAAHWLEGMPHTERLRDRAVKTRQGILMLKLVDTFFASSSPKRLILDTDVLWFKPPHEIFELLDQSYAFCMLGNAPTDFYFADRTMLSQELSYVNSGIVGYTEGDFTAEALEEFCSKADDDTNLHFIEQAGFAAILGARLTFLPETYHIKGPLTDNTIAKHYTGPRREQYWFEGVDRLRAI